jgi:hypothetical protein
MESGTVCYRYESLRNSQKKLGIILSSHRGLRSLGIRYDPSIEEVRRMVRDGERDALIAWALARPPARIWQTQNAS